MNSKSAAIQSWPPPPSRLLDRRPATLGEEASYKLLAVAAALLGAGFLFGWTRVYSGAEGSPLPTQIFGAIMLGYGAGVLARATWVAPFAAMLVASLIYALGSVLVSTARWAMGAETWPSIGRTLGPGVEAGMALVGIGVIVSVAMVVGASALDVLAERARDRRKLE